MGIIKEYFLRGKQRFWHRRRMGCLGGLVGPLLLCCLTVGAYVLLEVLDVSPWLVAILGGLVVVGITAGVVVLFIVGQRGGE